MSSEHLKRDAHEQATKNQLRKSVDPLHGLGQLSSLKSQNRSQGPPLSRAYLQPSSGTSYQKRQPPPLPPRGNNVSVVPDRYRYPGMNGYSGLNSYSGMNMYSPYSSRYTPGLYTNGLYSSPYSSYRMPFGHYGPPNDAYNSFLQMAEESTRPAFQSIESVVHVVNSISMMLESTYGAVYSSYNAILGVVDQFSRLKDHLAEVFSLLAMIRGLHWLCLKVLYLLKLRKTNPSVEAAWNKAQKAASSGSYPEPSGSAWPFFMFLSIVIGAPWLMFKLLSRNVTRKPFDPNMWLLPNGERMSAYGAYDFNSTQPGELSFRVGEKLYLNPKEFQTDGRTNKQWLHAYNENEKIGLVPVNYLLVPRNYLENDNQDFKEFAAALSAKSLAKYPVQQDNSKSYLDDQAFSGKQVFPVEDLPVSKIHPSDNRNVLKPEIDTLTKSNPSENLNSVTDSESKINKTND